MRRNFAKRISALLLLTALSAVIALSMVSCTKNDSSVQDSTEAVTLSELSTDTAQKKYEITFNVVFADKSEKNFTVKTDEEKVGAALLAEGLISGENGQYGLYVKTVAGETHDYNSDRKYWAFYINGEYAPTGVDSTDIVPGAVYSFKVE